jgi:hypothetical protein
VKIISFALLELEMADLEHFWRKTPLGPLGVKHGKSIHCILSFNSYESIISYIYFFLDKHIYMLIEEKYCGVNLILQAA